MSFIPWQVKQREGEPTASSPLAGLRHEIDKVFDTFVREPFGAVEWPFGLHGKWIPSVEIVESDEAVVVRVELPGVDPNAIDVTVVGNRLILAGDKPQPLRPEACEITRCEPRYGKFRRSLLLPERVHVESVDARYEHGILTLRVPKQIPGGAEKVHIKVAT